jgi:hypothetical protein
MGLDGVGGLDLWLVRVKCQMVFADDVVINAPHGDAVLAGDFLPL